MKPRFKLTIANGDRNITVKKAHEPTNITDMIEDIKILLVAWGYTEKAVKRILSPDEHISDLKHQIEDLQEKLNKQDGVFRICN